MSRYSRARGVVLSAVVLILTPLACDTGGIVGGTCRPGAELCEDVCRNTRIDREHCGLCGRECPEGMVCTAGECSPPGAGGEGGAGGGSGGVGEGGGSAQGGDAGAAGNGGDAGSGGSGANGGDAGSGANSGTGASGGSGATSGTGASGGDSGRGGRGGSGGRPDLGDAGDTSAPCLPPFDEATQCGDCDTQCTGATPLCAPDGAGSYECVPLCDPPLVACGDQCVDTQVHPLHCGDCFNECPSGICQAGMCVGANQGHLALYCENFAYVQQQSAHTALLGNSVFLTSRPEVRVLAFTRWSDSAVRAQVNRALAWSATARGRTLLLDTIRTPSQLSSVLNIGDYDVFLMYEQSAAPAGELATLGAAWGSSQVLESFARAGGVIVVLNGAQGTGEMPEFIRSAGLLNVTGHTPIALDDSTTRLYNRAPADALGINIVSPLSPVPYTCTFDVTGVPPADVVYVMTDARGPALGGPMLVHRTFAPTP